MTRKPITYCLATLLAALFTPLFVQAQGPMELRAAMQDMNRNLQAAADGLSRQDWAHVAKAAALIAEHPQPSAEEKTRIITFFGPEMGRFKGLDTETGEAAQQLARAAQDKNGKQAIAAFAQVQTGCLGCHEAFRERFISRFYAPDRLTRRD